MRTIVHFGMPKSGSTALQKGLSRAREALFEQGILYPRAPIIPHSHNLLMAGLVPPEDMPRFVRHSLKRAGEGPGLFDRWIAALGETMARGAAHTLVLSAENLWILDDADPAARLRAVLRGIGATRIEALAYLRRPSDWYLSAAGQVLAASHQVKHAGPIPYRAPIETIATHLADPGATRLRVYDRGTFPQGDILADFLAEMLRAPALPPQPARDANVTLSAEGLDLLQGYRRQVHPEANRTFTRDTTQFVAALKRAEGAVAGYARPALHPQIARKIDHGTPDLLWLRAAHGLTFDGIDYDGIGVETGTWRTAFHEVGQICPVDADRRERLMQHTFRELATALEAARGGKGKGADKDKGKG